MAKIYPVAYEGESPDEFGAPASRIGVLTIPLDEAREKEEYTIGGTMLWAISATSTGKLCEIQFQDYTSAEIPYGQGQSIRGVKFSRIYVTNAAQAGQSITFLYAVEGKGGLQIDNPLQDAGAVDISDPGTFSTMTSPNWASVGVAAGLVVSAAATTREVLLKASGANADSIFIGDSGVDGTTNGIEIEPGQSITIPTSDNIYAVSGTAAQSLQIMQFAN